MRRASTLALLLVAAVIGFALGRATGNGAAILAPNANFPLLPAPPKTAAYVAPVVAEREIIVESPADGAAVTFPGIEISGRAKYREGASVVLTLESSAGAVRTGTAELRPPAEGSYGRFSGTVSLEGWRAERVSLSAALVSSDGTEFGRDTRAVVIADDRVAVQVFFTNGRFDPEATCGAVFPVARQVSSATNVYRSTIEQLLDGPTDEEKAAGYGTMIPAGARLRSVAADAEGVARADFATTLDRGVGGSCRTAAIRAQITDSLTQFPEVHDVVISVNGRTEDILQP